MPAGARAPCGRENETGAPGYPGGSSRTECIYVAGTAAVETVSYSQTAIAKADFTGAERATHTEGAKLRCSARRRRRLERREPLCELPPSPHPKPPLSYQSNKFRQIVLPFPPSRPRGYILSRMKSNRSESAKGGRPEEHPCVNALHPYVCRSTRPPTLTPSALIAPSFRSFRVLSDSTWETGEEPPIPSSTATLRHWDRKWAHTGNTSLPVWISHSSKESDVTLGICYFRFGMLIL